ncbi:hypothetical protein [uncultured Sphingomonas sp.]|uniref:hypothetical protein n=1 Tax=uncultured Sphingomonas sp. TaxID=158754 RepID=UPI003748BFE1
MDTASHNTRVNFSSDGNRLPKLNGSLNAQDLVTQYISSGFHAPLGKFATPKLDDFLALVMVWTANRSAEDALAAIHHDLSGVGVPCLPRQDSGNYQCQHPSLCHSG